MKNKTVFSTYRNDRYPLVLSCEKLAPKSYAVNYRTLKILLFWAFI